eukprot:131956-Prymnesium_polylepis.1
MSLPSPPGGVHYGAPPGELDHEMLHADDAEARLGFLLTAQLHVTSRELLRNLPLENVPPDASTWMRPTVGSTQIWCGQHSATLISSWLLMASVAMASSPRKRPQLENLHR